MNNIRSEGTSARSSQVGAYAKASKSKSSPVDSKARMDAALLSRDRVSIGSSDASLLDTTYGSNGSIEEQQAEGDVSAEENLSGEALVRKLILDTLRKQGMLADVDVGNGETKSLESMTPEEAQALVADDGYWGVEQTSDRMLDQIVALAGGDASRMEEIKAGVAEGFARAEKAFGGQLPDISYRTRDRLLEKLDAWASSAKPAESAAVGATTTA